jgi:hypothetical protein
LPIKDSITLGCLSIYGIYNRRNFV